MKGLPAAAPQRDSSEATRSLNSSDEHRLCKQDSAFRTGVSEHEQSPALQKTSRPCGNDIERREQTDTIKRNQRLYLQFILQIVAA